MKRPTDGPGENPARHRLGAGEIPPARAAHGAHVAAVIGVTRATFGAEGRRQDGAGPFAFHDRSISASEIPPGVLSF